MSKVVLLLVDGMRPDAMEMCKNPFLDKLKKNSFYTQNAKTVMPTVTLPCHFSLFHSVSPERHGILTNVYTPQVRPIDGLCEIIKYSGKSAASFYNWEQLRDLSRPDSLIYSNFINLHNETDSDNLLTNSALEFLKAKQPDFIFLYLGETDGKGHKTSWMSEEYLKVVSNAISCIEKIYENLPEDYSLIITSDHGGHDRTHGTDSKEDITIPLFICGKPINRKGLLPDNVNIIDIAPTVAKLLGISKNIEWEGKELI